MGSQHMKDWKEVEFWCKKHFSFLMNDFDCVIHETESELWFFSLILRNKTTGLRFLFELRDQCFFVMFSALEHGEYLRNPIMIRSIEDVQEYDFNDLLLIRAPDEIWPKSKTVLEYQGYIMTTAPFEDQISHKAKMLKLHGEDILTGDFSILKEIRKNVKARIKNSRLSE